jgi:hypothetical protein
MPRSPLRFVVLAVSVVAGDSTSMPSSVFRFATLRARTVPAAPASTRTPLPWFALIVFPVTSVCRAGGGDVLSA